MNITQIILLIIAAAFVALVWYFIRLIKDLRTTLGKVDRILESNEENLSQITDNLSKITYDTHVVTYRTAKVVKGFERAMGQQAGETGIAQSIVKTKEAIGIANLSFLVWRFLKRFTHKQKKAS